MIANTGQTDSKQRQIDKENQNIFQPYQIFEVFANNYRGAQRYDAECHTVARHLKME